MIVRAARADEIETIRDIERSAAAKFRGHPLDDPKLAEPGDAEGYETARRAGLLWVAVDADDRPAGHLTASAISEGLYVAQFDVRPEWQGRGIGRLLMARAVEEARMRDMPALWLRTFRDVAWNAPYYERLGFRVVSDNEPASIAAALMAHEREAGLDGTARCAMMLRIGAEYSPAV